MTREQSVIDYLDRLQSTTTDPVLLDRIDALRARVTSPAETDTES
jgi:hypothetical protein